MLISMSAFANVALNLFTILVTGIAAGMVVVAGPCDASATPARATRSTVPSRLEPLRREIEIRALGFFLDHAHPVTGMVRDKADNFGPTPTSNVVSSVAATGFALAVVANASEQGLISRQDAEAYVLRSLRFADSHITKDHGWLFHFVDWSTGERAWRSEVSTIDTALFLAGALYAAEIFGGEAKFLSEKMYAAVDFEWFMTDGGAKPGKRTLSLSYTPEQGFVPHQWSEYAEQMILLILGLGHPTKPLPKEAWNVWRRQRSPLQPVMAPEMPLFVHQYSHVFIDFRGFSDGYPNYFENSVRATQLHRSMARLDSRYESLRKGYWGFSAGISANGYEVFTPTYHRGTVCIGCAVASMMFLPLETLEDAERWKAGSHTYKTWGLYGFTDSLDLDEIWFSSDVLGITVGPAYMAAANADDRTSVWKRFMAISAVKRGLEKASRP